LPFQVIKGEGISEVPVGPIHAGIIEPGHFRFSVLGERVVHLEARLFYVHRGIEKICEGLDVCRALEVVERICGVCTFSHAVAFCQAVEAIGRVSVPPRGVALRTALLELERLYNHVGDTGNLCAGTSLAAGAMAGARIKDDLQSLAERLTGSRYLRGIACPGGLRRDFSAEALTDFAATVARAAREAAALQSMLLATDSFMRRLYGTGTLPRQVAADLGAVGVAARASGLERDIRLAHPFAAYGTYAPRLCTEPDGDVHARFSVRLRELQESARLIDAILSDLPGGAVSAPLTSPLAGSALGWTESPRGEHVHWLRLGVDGLVDRLRVRAASFCNWPVVPLTVPGNMVPDFPLINKSFELCYSCLDR
jgi:Ni,Fe-hydrogenase III large subunit